MENNQVALRLRNGDNPGAMALDAFLKQAEDEIAQKI